MSILDELRTECERIKRVFEGKAQLPLVTAAASTLLQRASTILSIRQPPPYSSDFKIPYNLSYKSIVL